MQVKRENSLQIKAHTVAYAKFHQKFTFFFSQAVQKLENS